MTSPTPNAKPLDLDDSQYHRGSRTQGKDVSMCWGQAFLVRALDVMFRPCVNA
jgi:hypothetical protein